jgi:tripartite-type tricarboxylate transporter receptor subunit TctC
MKGCEREGPTVKLPRRQFLYLAAGTAALLAVSRFAGAQAYPSRPVRVIVGFAAGGSADSDGSGPRRHVSAGAAAAEMPAQSVRA